MIHYPLALYHCHTKTDAYSHYSDNHQRSNQDDATSTLSEMEALDMQLDLDVDLPYPQHDWLSNFFENAWGAEQNNAYDNHQVERDREKRRMFSSLGYNACSLLLLGTGTGASRQ